MDKGPFKPVFVPDVLIPKVPRVQKRIEDMTDEERERFSKHLATIVGDESEKDCFENFKKILTTCDCSKKRRRTDQHKCFYKKYAMNMRTILFNGVEFLFPDAESKKELKGEFDEVQVIDELKLIIYAELKVTFSRNLANKKDQFGRFKELIQSHFPVGEGWRVATSYGFSKLPENGRLCQECAKYVFFVNKTESMRKWMNNIVKTLKPKEPIQGKKGVFIALRSTDTKLSLVLFFSAFEAVKGQAKIRKVPFLIVADAPY